MTRRNQPDLPRLCVVGLSKQELADFVTAMRRVAELVQGLETAFAGARVVSAVSTPCYSPDALFDAIWEDLSIAGCCDDKGSAEYTRVKRVWEREQKPAGIAVLIFRESNAGPNPTRAGEKGGKR